jgi:hypothetical protein
VVPGCDVERGLEIDHLKVPFAEGGPTELWNLARLCKWHRYMKTDCDYALEGAPGEGEWQGPKSERNPVLTA